MKWKKIMSVLIAAVFVMSGVAVVASSASAEEAQYIQHITLEVRTTMETGLGDTAVGDIDVFIQTVPAELYDGISDEWKAQLGTWMSSGSYTNFMLNPAFDQDTTDAYPDEDVSYKGGLPVVQVDGEWQFNPTADREIRFANNFMVDRTEYLEDLYDGYGSERYFAMGQEEPGYEEYYRPIIEELEIHQDGDWERAWDMVQGRMEYWADHPGINEWTGEEVTNEGTADDPEWHFGGEQIEVISANRVEDERLSMGHDWSDKMEEMGFAVERIDGDGATLFGMTLFADASAMTFNMYTGGWIASAANVYQHAAMNQMYAGWYGWTVGLGSPDHWQIRPVQDPELEEKGRDLMAGRVPTEDMYWEYMQDMAEIGIRESVRVFLVTTYDFFAYDADRVAEAATDVVTGWAGIYSPRSLKINDPDGEFKAAQYSTVGALYMDNWNRIDGSGDTYSMQQQDMARDFTMYNHPSEGMPIGIRTDYDYDRDYDWVEDDEGEFELEKRMDVPEGAWDYDTETQEWYEVGEDLKAATAVTFDWHENTDGDLGTYHDGNPLTYRDILAWYAFSKELTFDDGHGYYYEPWGNVNEDWFNNIHGIELHWDGDEVTSYTMYGDYTFPSDDMVASYYSQTTFKPWQVYEAARIMIAQHEDESDLWEDVPGAGEIWDWSESENWIHFIGSAQVDTFESVMQNMIDNDWQPAYFDNIPVGEVDLETEIGRTLDFTGEHNHMFISQGPFKITVVDEPNMVMEMERWGEDDGYPLAIDHWEDILVVRRIELRQVTMPSRVDAGQEFQVEASARIREDYPVSQTFDATYGEVRVRIFVPGEDPRVATVDAPVEDGRFVVDIPSEMTAGLSGSFEVQIEATIPEAVSPSIIERSLLVIPAEDEVIVEDFEVDPLVGDAPLDISVSASIQNPTDTAHDVNILIDGDVERTITVEAGDTVSVSEIITLEEAGDYVINLEGQTRVVEVSEPDVEPVEVSDFVVDPASGTAPLDVSITAEVFNPGDERDFDVKVAGEVIETYTIGAEETVNVDETHTFEESGDYIVMVAHRRQSVSVEPEEEPEPDIVVSNFNVDPTDGEAPLEVDITADLENQGDAEGTITLTVDGEQVNSWTLGAGETATVDETYEFEDEGTYTVELDGHTETVEVEEETPGFTLVALAISAVAAVLLYHKKKSDE